MSFVHCYIVFGLIAACIFGTHIYHKMIGDKNEKTLCVMTGILAGLGAFSLWPFIPFILLYNVYEKWEDERTRKRVLAHLEKKRKANTQGEP